jgi:hypothetical protein
MSVFGLGWPIDTEHIILPDFEDNISVKFTFYLGYSLPNLTVPTRISLSSTFAIWQKNQCIEVIRTLIFFGTM